MKIVGCDLHARQQSIAMLDSETTPETRVVSDFNGRPEDSSSYGCIAPRIAVLPLGNRFSGWRDPTQEILLARRARSPWLFFH
jgi:hypothetical protein